MENLVNKLVLGTAQLGLDYGINNQNGKPTRESAMEMLDFAYKNGIKIFDTAYAYGNAEEILGEFLRGQNLGEEIKIITKINPGSPEDVSLEIKKSLEKLGLSSVDGCLFHNPEHIKNERMVETMSELKKQGLAKNIGVSVYEPEDAVYSAKIGEIDYIQIPYNIFDQRLSKTDFFELAQKNNKKVFARSAFLQGLLLMPIGKIPARLESARPHLAKLDAIIAKYGLSKKQVAMNFALANKNIDYIVFGADNKNQLKEVIDIAKQEIDFNQCKKELEKEFDKVEKYIISPNLWQK